MFPALVRTITLPTLEALLGRKTFAYYRQMQQEQWLGADEIRAIQLARLRDLLAVALKQTKDYAQLANRPADWLPSSLDDLRALPLLDKATLTAHREALTNAGVPGGPVRYTTGGSSGQPLIFYFDKRRQAVDKAARMLTHEWWQVRPGDREAYIWGSPVELSKQDRMKQARDWLINDMLLPAFDLSETTVPQFVAKLRRFKPACLFGYCSSITLLCQIARRAGIDLSDIPLKAAFCTAEVLYDYQRQTISEAFGGVPVVNGYGSREGGFISHDCPAGNMHIMSTSVIVEFLQDGKPVAEGQDGEIVLTHLDNYAMPFIRYRTGDIGQPSKAKCSCGRGLEVMKSVKGRSTDFVVTPDGRWVHGLALIYVVREFPGVAQFQIVQKDVDDVRVRLIVQDGFPPDGQEAIRQGLVKRLGPDVRVRVESVDAIAQDASGKFRYVISEVARQRQALM